MADDVIEIKSYFLSPPRPNSFAMAAGNTAPKLDLAPPPDLAPKARPGRADTPEPNTSWQNNAVEPAKKEAAPMPGGTALRAVCDVCGYKNPRDVAVCMKCGEKLPGTPVGTVPTEKPALAPLPTPTPAPSPAPASVAVEPVSGSNTMVEIPIMKLVAGVVVAILVVGDLLSLSGRGKSGTLLAPRRRSRSRDPPGVSLDLPSNPTDR